MFQDHDPQATERKKDHIELAFQSQIGVGQLDTRFYYEPLLAAHPAAEQWAQPFSFLGKTMQTPLWVSSMTGGTEWARHINHQLARVAGEFGMGMGLGSCRSLLTDDAHLSDFDVRHLLGDDLPLYANLGIAQIERLLDNRQLPLLDALLHKLRADGLIVHVNPMQEWLQPEGDCFLYPPCDTIERLIDARPQLSLIVKEVGQGMGFQSLKRLLALPLRAVDFAASGGTNFAKLELLRSSPAKQQIFETLANIGHSAADMVNIANQVIAELGSNRRCPQIIVSGGIRSFLDGYYCLQKLSIPAIYGQASAFLQHARGDYQTLRDYVEAQVQGFRVAEAFLRVR